MVLKELELGKSIFIFVSPQQIHTQIQIKLNNNFQTKQPKNIYILYIKKPTNPDSKKATQLFRSEIKCHKLHNFSTKKKKRLSKQQKKTKKVRNGPNSRSSSEYQNRRVILRRVDPVRFESLPHDRAQLHNISSLEPAEQLSRGASNTLHQELERAASSRQRWRRRDG